MSEKSKATRMARRHDATSGRGMADFNEMIREMEMLGARVERRLVIQRADVENMNLAPYLHPLLSILGDKDAIIRRRQDVRPSIHGYGSDPRELCQIPEVRAFLSRLDQQFPYWFYFLDPACDFLGPLMACLCTCRGSSPSPNPGKTLLRLDEGSVAAFATRHLMAMNDLIRRHGLDDENGTLSKKLTRDVIATLHLDGLDGLLSE